MTAYAIQYRDGAWQLDPKNWHPDFVVHRVLAVYRSHPREHVETVRETLVRGTARYSGSGIPYTRPSRSTGAAVIGRAR